MYFFYKNLQFKNVINNAYFYYYGLKNLFALYRPLLFVLGYLFSCAIYIILSCDTLLCVDELHLKIVQLEEDLSYWVREGYTLRQTYNSSGLKDVPVSQLTGAARENKLYLLDCMKDNKTNVEHFSKELASARAEQENFLSADVKVVKRPLDDNSSK